MKTKGNRIRALVLCASIAATGTALLGQNRRAAPPLPQIDVDDYTIQATLMPETHELKAVAGITFKVLQPTDAVVFELSENLSVQKVLDRSGVEIDFGQDETGPGLLTVHFPKRLDQGSTHTIKVEYTGGYDRDRYSRMYSRDESSAYIGPDSVYLLYGAKWFPTNKFLTDRATATVEITVPLGMTVIGPGTQLPVVTKTVTETFGWAAKRPILPNSIVAGRYFEKKIPAGSFTLDCFVREDKLQAVKPTADAVGKILDYYQKAFGPSASGTTFRLVEVDDRLALQPGTLGTIFVTHRDLTQQPNLRQLARHVAYQWWMDTVGAQSAEDLWLVDGLSYYSAAMFLGQSGGPAALKEEIGNLAVLGLKFEAKSAIRNASSLGYRSEPYESVVGGKGAWVAHMLRELIGDAKFRQLMQQYVQQFAGKGGSTTAFRQLAEKVYGKELGWFFAEWIDAMGVPEFRTDYVVYKTTGGFRVSGSVKQDRDLFRMPLEVEVVTKNKTERTTVDLNGKSTTFDINTFALPKDVVLDPDSKILRDSKDLQISVQLALGNDMKQREQYVEAIRAYEAALKIDSHRSLAHFRLAEVFYEQFNLQAAANSFRDALNGDKAPPWIEVWSYIYLGKIYDILGQRQRAMAEYNKALNTKDDTDGAQAEAKKWLAAPFTRERTTMETKDTRDTKQP
jgi:aminopeptidase N